MEPGDILLYRPTSWIGRLISWGQWTGKPGEGLEYSHVAICYGEGLCAEMNPPSSRLFSANRVPSDASVYRPLVNGQPAIALNTVAQMVLKEVIKDRLQQPYAWQKIGKFTGLGLLSRVGLGPLARLLLRLSPDEKHVEVCSTWAAGCVETTISNAYNLPGFTLFPGSSSDDMRPADLPLSPFLLKIF